MLRVHSINNKELGRVRNQLDSMNKKNTHAILLQINHLSDGKLV
jgi:ClpP class serine protease